MADINAILKRDRVPMKKKRNRRDSDGDTDNSGKKDKGNDSKKKKKSIGSKIGFSGKNKTNKHKSNIKSNISKLSKFLGF